MISLGACRALPPTVDSFTLDGDADKPMPAIGFGTCCRKSARGPPLIASTKEFLAQGGRLIDTAQMYKNHVELGVAIRESGVAREQLWLTTKVNTRAVSTRGAAVKAVENSARELGVAYLDLVLIHGLWTISLNDAIEVWRGLIDAKAAKLVRHIGISNFERPQIERIIAATGVRPAVHQLEFHPYVNESVHELVAWCQQEGIVVTAYGSLGSSTNKAVGEEVAKVAAAHGVTPAALLLRWALNRGVAIIPGATSAAHIRENLHLPSVTMSGDELQSIGSTSTRPSTFRHWNNLPSEVSGSRMPPGPRGSKMGVRL